MASRERDILERAVRFIAEQARRLARSMEAHLAGRFALQRMQDVRSDVFSRNDWEGGGRP